MKKLLVAVALSVFGSGTLAWAEGASEVQNGQARVRFFGQAAIGLTFYENQGCEGGDGIVASNTGFGGLFGSKKNISLGMPDTPNVTNLKDRNGILARAFFREYAVNAGEPLTIVALHKESTGNTSYSCGPLKGSFIPEGGKDYEVALNFSNRMCHLNVMRIDSSDAGVTLLPVLLSSANECVDKEE